MSLKDRILDGISNTLDKYIPRKKSENIKSDVEDNNDSKEIDGSIYQNIGRGGRNSHLTYKKR